MLRYLDFNDTWHGGHPSDLIGGLLAIAESVGADGGRLLAAMIVGYEVALRLIRATQLPRRAAGIRVLRSASAPRRRSPACSACRSSRRRTQWRSTAVANACAAGDAGGPAVAVEGALRHRHACHQRRVFAALLAIRGVTGPDRPFEGRHGL